MQKKRKYLVIFALVTAVILSCGIPTSMPILPKKVDIKASPSVSVPLGQVNYNLYSGLTGGSMTGGIGSLNDLLGVSWLTDLEKQGVKVYDYRPAGSADDSIQKFLLHYKLNMEDTMGGAGEIDMSEYGDMLGDLTNRDPEPIDNVLFSIEEVKMDDTVDVIIPLGGVTAALKTEFDSYPAVLPVENGETPLEFPDDLKNYPLLGNDFTKFLVKLNNMDFLTLASGKLNFIFTLKDPSPGSSPPMGSTLELSNFMLRGYDENDAQYNILNTESSPTQSLSTIDESKTGWIKFNNAELPDKFELVCDLKIKGNGGNGVYKLEIEPKFDDDVTISGVENLVLSDSQKDSLKHTLDPADPDNTHPIGVSMGPSFTATVETGYLEIDEPFPPLNNSGTEGWNLKMNLEQLSIKQGNPQPPNNNVKGLSLDGLTEAKLSDSNNLHGEVLNSQPVVIGGIVTMNIADVGGGDTLTFRNLDPGIKMGDPDEKITKKLDVNLKVSLFSVVEVTAEDIGLKDLAAIDPIEQELGKEFSDFRPWLNYIEFEGGGLGALLTIETLHVPDGLALYINAPVFGLNHAHRPLENIQNPAPGKEANARLTFTNAGAYTLWEQNITDPLRIDVELGMENQTEQQKYLETGIMTLRNVAVPSDIELTTINANMVFDWAFMSVVPQTPKEGEPKNEDLPDYPFAGSFPEEDDEGIDLSAFPKGLQFYVPEDGKPDSETMSASLYISLKRQRLGDDGIWVDEEADDPTVPGYKQDDPYGWSRNLRVNLPKLEFKVQHGDDTSGNLFSEDPPEAIETGLWTLARALNLEDPLMVDQGLITNDTENANNPFKIYTGPLPGKAIPLVNLAKEFNKHLIGGKNLYFEYKVALSETPNDEPGSLGPEEMIIYPHMLEKKIVASADLLIELPMKFRAYNPDTPNAPVAMDIASDLVGGDLFGRSGPEDNGFFDFVTSLGFDTGIKNMAGLKAGAFFIQNKNEGEEGFYRIPTPILDFSTIETKTQNRFTLNSEVMETIKGIWPFDPKVLVEFPPNSELRFNRNFNIELQSITVKASGEYTFETGW